MSTQSRRPELPMAAIADQQIRYIADNERDAEALQYAVDCPVILRRTSRLQSPAPTTEQDAPTSQVLETSEHPERLEPLPGRQHPDASYVSDVSDSAL